MSDEPSDAPLTPAEMSHYRARASAGEHLPLGVIRRFILTIRKTFSASPAKTEKAQKTRNAKPKPDESQIDFF